MVSWELDNVLITSVRLMQSINVVGLYEVVLLARREQCRDEASCHVGQRGQLVHVEACLLLDRLLDHCHGSTDQELGHFGM